MTVTGADITGVTLALQPGRIFSGALVAEGYGSAGVLEGHDGWIQPIVARRQSFSLATRQMPVGDDGRFSVGGLEPYRLRGPRDVAACRCQRRLDGRIRFVIRDAISATRR